MTSTGQPATKKAKRSVDDVSPDHLVVMAAAVGDVVALLSNFDKPSQYKVLGAVCVIVDYQRVVAGSSDKKKVQKSPSKSKTSVKASDGKASSVPGSNDSLKNFSDGKAPSTGSAPQGGVEPGEVAKKKRKKKKHVDLDGKLVGPKGHQSVPNSPNIIWDDVGMKLKKTVEEYRAKFKEFVAEVPKRTFHTKFLEPANHALRDWKRDAAREGDPEISKPTAPSAMQVEEQEVEEDVDPLAQ
jgi:hypothetical protein